MMKRPERRSDFLSTADELNYLSDLVQYYAAANILSSSEASDCLDRFAGLLRQLGLDDGSIMLQDHWAVLYEATGNLLQATKHREREIQLINELFAIGGPIWPIDEEFRNAKIRLLAAHYGALGEYMRMNDLLERLNHA